MAPGWQALNDLRLILLDPTGKSTQESVLVPSNAEGVYSWWGTAFAWSPDGARIAYARADKIGWVDRQNNATHSLATLPPYQARSDWVWLPQLAWTPDNRYLLAVIHGAAIGMELPESSPVFDLAALPLNGSPAIILAHRTGMFAYPTTSPKRKEGGYNVAFLQALRPLESDQSQYRLVVMDQDASNMRNIFPAEGDPGISPQHVGWSPDGTQIALIYHGNLWLVDVASGTAQPVTSDGQVTTFDWK
jgi:Tol biopolymer transport system component